MGRIYDLTLHPTWEVHIGPTDERGVTRFDWIAPGLVDGNPASDIVLKLPEGKALRVIVSVVDAPEWENDE